MRVAERLRNLRSQITAYQTYVKLAAAHMLRRLACVATVNVLAHDPKRWQILKFSLTIAVFGCAWVAIDWRYRRIIIHIFKRNVCVYVCPISPLEPVNGF